MTGALIALAITIILSYFLLNIIPHFCNFLNHRFGLPSVFPGYVNTRIPSYKKEKIDFTKYPVFLTQKGLLTEIRAVSKRKGEWTFIVDFFNTTDTTLYGELKKISIEWEKDVVINDEKHVLCLDAGEGILATTKIECRNRKEPKKIIVRLTIEEKEYTLCFNHEKYNSLKENNNNEIFNGE